MPRKKKTPSKITVEQQLKIARKVRRDLEIEQGLINYGRIWKTTKKDKQENKSNTIKPEDYE